MSSVRTFYIRVMYNLIGHFPDENMRKIFEEVLFL